MLLGLGFATDDVFVMPLFEAPDDFDPTTVLAASADVTVQVDDTGNAILSGPDLPALVGAIATAAGASWDGTDLTGAVSSIDSADAGEGVADSLCIDGALYPLEGPPADVPAQSVTASVGRFVGAIPAR